VCAGGKIEGITDLTMGKTFTDRHQGYTHALSVDLVDKAALETCANPLPPLPHPADPRYSVDRPALRTGQEECSIGLCWSIKRPHHTRVSRDLFPCLISPTNKLHVNPNTLTLNAKP